MPNTFRQFANNIRSTGIKVERNAEQIQRKTALACDQAIVMASPVDTGRFRSNWQVSVGNPDTGVIDAYAPGEGGETGASNTAAALAQAQGALLGHQPGQDIWITNNLPYAQRLNDGYSPQAPSGFVQRAVAAAQEAVRNSRVLKDG